MQEKLEKLVIETKQNLKLISDDNELSILRSSVLGKKSELSDLMVLLKGLPNEEKPLMGKLINQTKVQLEAMFDEKKMYFENLRLENKLKHEAIDVTLPGVSFPNGSSHLLQQVIEDFETFFIGLGYEIKEY